MDIERVEGKIVAQHQSGFVTMVSRDPRGARGTFIVLYDHQTPQRSPRLLKNDARVQPRSADRTIEHLFVMSSKSKLRKYCSVQS